MMSSMMGTQQDDTEYAEDTVHSQSIMTGMMETMFSEISTNNLEAFKQWLESGETNIQDLVTDIQYGYDTPLNIYQSDTSGGVVRVNPSTVFDSMGMAEMVSYSAMSMMGTDVWTQLVGDNALLETQYDVLAGHLPESANEVVLIVGGNNEITDYTLYSLGLKDTADLTQAMENMMNGEAPGLDTEPAVYTYDELLGLSFRLVPTSAYFAKDESGLWEDKSEDEDYMKSVVESADEVTVVGIIRPSEDAMMSSTAGVIGYTGELMDMLLDEIESSEIVTEQLENPDIDVFTGVAFPQEGEDTGGEELTMEALTAYIASLPEDEQAQASAAIAQMQGAGMGEDEILAAFSAQIGPTSTTATYEGNLSLMGRADPSSPSSISIYAKDFESKEAIEALISDYNAQMEAEGNEENAIQYTDLVGLMMSSVSTIIDAVSYVLIAFVSISLVVSSIMIGIITYISVLERTKEIGILRAIGASKKDVSRVFNAETLIIGFVAGAIGIGVTLLLCLPANAIIKNLAGISGVAKLPWAGAVILVCISMLLTFIAGLIPSRLAAKKDPVVALRTE
jgi:putative ABC transport system permease protein